MSKKDKLLQSIINNPKNVRFEELEKLLISNGYKVYNTGGSHYVFRKNNCDSQVIPYKKPIKAYYLIPFPTNY